MATLRIATHVGSTRVFLTSIGTTTGTPDVAGYELTQVADIIHEATITGLTGPFSVRAENDDEEIQAYVYPVTMVNDASVIDTTVEDETKINAIVADAATAATQATAAATDAATAATQSTAAATDAATAATQSTAAATDAATTVTQTEKASLRFAVGGRWTDEKGKTFDLTIEDTP